MFFLKNRNLSDAANKTPAARDRYVDFLRAASIVIVVIGHWISACILIGADGIKFYNAVGLIPGMWLVTWVLQVMPVFFFIGGFSNYATFGSITQRGGRTSAFFKSRLARLLKPTAVFLVFTAVACAIAALAVPGWPRYCRACFASIVHLWFLAVYVIVILLVPLMIKIHARHGWRALAVLASLALVVDVFRLGFAFSHAGWLNVLFVWLFVHQLGFFYADGSLMKIPKRILWLAALAGLGLLVLLTNINVYPRSMVGTGFEKISNMNPPTVCILALSLWLIGVAMCLRDTVNRWLKNFGLWVAVIAANTAIMTLYLWHIAAFAIAFLILYRFGLGHGITSVGRFWLERPVWIAAPGIILIAFVAVFGRFERPRRG